MVRLSSVAALCGLAGRVLAAATGEQLQRQGFYDEGGPEYDQDTWIGLINATPYRWAREYQHSYQMTAWESKWPAYVEPGQAVQAPAERRKRVLWHADSAAEVRYRLEGTARPMGLQMEYRRGAHHGVWVRFVDELHTAHDARGSEHDLGFVRHPGGVGFVLAGDERGGFVANGGPPGWMQASLRQVGHLALRELALPRTHHSGMWKGVAAVGFGSAGNTLAQTQDLGHQLRDGGVRVLDVRPAWIWEQFRVSHTSQVPRLGLHGMVGAGVEEMVDVVNGFNDEHPGELVILDVHRDVHAIYEGRARALDRPQTLALYDVLKRLRHRLRGAADGEDLTAWPLARFIGNGSSAVVVRCHATLRDAHPDLWPGAAQGFITEREMEYRGDWSDKNRVDHMVEDQLAQLARLRPRRDSPAFNAQWIITLDTLQSVWPLQSLVRVNGPAWRALYHEFWKALSDQTYPNWITVDALHGSQLKALAMAINLCLGARRCGSLGGKVQGSGVADRHPVVNATMA